MNDSPTLMQIIATCLFAVALAHTFAARQLERLSRRFRSHAGLFHLLGEVEVVFGFWSIVLIATMAFVDGGGAALGYAESRQYAEPLFVFAVMVIAASHPVVGTISRLAQRLARSMPVAEPLAIAWLGLAVVPLAGSLVTEPAAMTIAALLLAPIAFRSEVPERAKYAVLGALFVNVSIGGTLTSYAAPPVLMVAASWQWDSHFIFATFGWKAALAVVVNATWAVLWLRPHLARAAPVRTQPAGAAVPTGIAAASFGFLAAVVMLAHHPVAFLAVFLMFLGFAHAYERHHRRLILREALLVGFFLAGLVVLGGMQQWWLQPLVEEMSPRVLFFGAAALTAVTDNAALTYLGSLVQGLPPEARYSLVAGAVAGGGLTVIANAPNPAGAALLRRGFANDAIGAWGLLRGAFVPTVFACAAFML